MSFWAALSGAPSSHKGQARPWVSIADIFEALFSTPPRAVPAPRQHHQPARQPTPVRNSAPVRHPPSRGRDVLSIVGFGEQAYVVLPPTSVSKFSDRSRIDALARPPYFRAASGTNLTAGIETALQILTDPRAPRARRIVCLTDGAANRRTEELRALGPRMRAAHVSFDVIFIGDAAEAASVRKLCADTVGGTFFTARDVREIANRLDALSRPGRRDGNGRRWGNLLLVDGSASMNSVMADGKRRIEAVPAATHQWVALQGVQHGQ